MELNVNQNVSDAFYRYKMPQLSAKVEGKGNGIKTVIVNVTDIAKKLYRKPIYVTKYFGCELGAQIHVDDKNDRYIVNGAHDTARLQELLFGFINKFVLCPNCGNPETTLHVKVKAGVVNTTCTACGNRGQLDPRHRLTQFIIKNPPEDEATPADKKGKRSKKAKNGKDQQPEEEDQTPAGDDGHNSQSLSEDDEDVDWGEDTTEEAQQKRLAELSEMARNLTINADVEKTEAERANMFFKLIAQYKQADDVVSRGLELKKEAQRLNLGLRSVLVVAEVLLSDPKTLVSDIKRYKPVFLPFTRVGDQQHKVQGYLLGAIASLIQEHEEELLPKACHILKELYDSDIVEEEVILPWFEKNSAKRYVSKPLAAKIAEVCAPMLTWLREADEESDEDEENEEEEHEEKRTNGDDTARKSHLVSTKVAAAADESEDDLDIDAI